MFLAFHRTTIAGKAGVISCLRLAAQRHLQRRLSVPRPPVVYAGYTFTIGLLGYSSIFGCCVEFVPQPNR